MSPDLNPIENLWKQLKVRINSRATKNLQELKQIAIEERNIIPPETASNLVTTKEKYSTAEGYQDKR